MAKFGRRDKRKKQNTKTDSSVPKMGFAWTHVWTKSPSGHPKYLPDSPDIKFARRAIEMALTASRNKRMVDLGAGRGEVTSTVSRTGGHVTLLDPAKVPAMRQRMSSERAHAYIEKLPKEWTGKFGVASMNYSLVYTKDKEMAISEIRRILDEGGKLVATIHHPESTYVKGSKVREQYNKIMIQLLEDTRRKRIKTYAQACQVMEMAAKMPFAGQGTLDAVNMLLDSYFKGKKRSQAFHSQKKVWDQKLGENIERIKVQETSFKPLRKGNLFPNEAAVREFFEGNGFKVRLLKTLKKGNDIYCYAIYAQKI